MVMLSNFLRFRLSDEQGRTGQLLDVAVDLSAGDYPRVGRVLLRTSAQKTCSLAWEQVTTVDSAGAQWHAAAHHLAQGSNRSTTLAYSSASGRTTPSSSMTIATAITPS